MSRRKRSGRSRSKKRIIPKDPPLCDYCGRPMVAYSLSPKKPTKNVVDLKVKGKVIERFEEVYGPKTMPQIPRWCGADCDWIWIEINLIIDRLRRKRNVREERLKRMFKELKRILRQRDHDGKEGAIG